MIELVLVYCLSGSPDRCLERREPLEESVSLMSCAMSGQIRAQDYLRAHPTYSLKTWRCEVDKPRESPA